MTAVHRYLSVTHVLPISSEQSVLAMDKLLGVLARVWRPSTARFVVTAGADQPVLAGWQVSGVDATTVEAMACDIRDAVSSIAPWLGLTDVTRDQPWPTMPPVSHVLRPGAASPHVLVSAQALAWSVARRSPDSWAMSVDLLSLPGPDATPDPDGVVDESVTGWSGRAVTCAVRLHGDGAQREVIAALLAEDTAGPVSVVAAPVRGAVHDVVDLPVRSLAHLLATPARIRDAFQEHPVVDDAELVSQVLSAPAPHVLAIGASGQGKTTLLAHLVRAGLHEGARPVLVDVEDGRSIDALKQSCRREGLEPLVVRLGSALPSTVHLTRPPAGVSAEAWADELYTTLRSVLWADMPDEYFGPVGERAVRHVLCALIRDPDGPRPLADAPRLLDPDDDEFRDALLERIGDPALTRAICREVMPMFTTRESGNGLVWLLSKLEPLIGPAAVRAVTEDGWHVVDLEAAVADGQPILVHAPTAVLGDGASRVLVLVVLQRIWWAVQRRATGPTYDIVLDEFQKYAGTTITDLLARGRKRGVRLRLANQHASQLPRPVLDAVLGNTGTLCCFRLGPADAALLEGRYPTVTIGQLQRLPDHHVAVTTGASDGIYHAPAPPALALAGTGEPGRPPADGTTR